MSETSEIRRVVESHRLYQGLLRLLRRGPDTTDKTRAFRRDVLNALAADRFEQEEFADTEKFYSRDALLEHCLRAVPAGRTQFVELGVGSGTSTKLIMSTARTLGHSPTLHGFDSFEGLPEAWGEIAPAGTYSYRQPDLDDTDVVFHRGWFSDTVPDFAATVSTPLGFVHVDCDLYSSTKTAFDALSPLLTAGTVILFDEYWNYLEAPEHEQKALREFCRNAGRGFRYLGYNVDFMQAAVVLTEPTTQEAGS